MEVRMERQDDAEHHEEASGDDPGWGDYPRGRGYGQDYMRGGEVFGGYGYSERPEYARPLAEQRSGDEREQPGATTSNAGGLTKPSERPGDADAIEAPDQRFPQDARAGDWDQPAPAVLDEATPTTAPAHDGPPVPAIEGSYGTEGNRNRSRSYYLTQAQLQHRLEGPQTGTKRT
jgi:hypothetical protein